MTSSRSRRPASSRFRIRSALTCEVRVGVCAVCYGRDLARGTPVNMGEAVGVIAAQSIGEPGTQLTMRTFHIGGTAQVVDSSFLEASYEGKVEIRNRNVVRNSDGQQIVMGRNMAVLILDEAGKERATHRRHLWFAYLRGRWRQGEARPAYRRVGSLYPSGPHRNRGQGRRSRIWSTAFPCRKRPTSRPASPSVRSSTGARRHAATTSSRRLPSRTPRARSASCRTGGDARFLLSVEAILSVEPGAQVRPGDVLARIPLESAKTKDITGGLPRVAELFEARRPKDHAIIAEIDGTIRFGRDYKNKRRIIIEPEDSTLEPVEYLIPKGKPFHLQDGDAIEKGDYILDGNPAPHDILAIKGVEAACFLPRQRDPGSLPPAGRVDQRQAHRGDRSPDAAEGRDHRRRATPTYIPGDQRRRDRLRRGQRAA